MIQYNNTVLVSKEDLTFIDQLIEVFELLEENEIDVELDDVNRDRLVDWLYDSADKVRAL